MKSTFLAIFLLFHFVSSISALDVSVYPATFYEDGQGYVEMHYFFAASTIGWKTVDDSLMNASAKVQITFSRGEVVMKYDKYIVQSPNFNSAADFRDVQRYSLEPGKYTLSIKIEDESRTGNAVSFNTSIMISPPTEVDISDIVLLSDRRPSKTDTPFDKYGFYMEAMPFNFLTSNSAGFDIYAEVYHADQLANENYSLRLQFETILEDGSTKPYQGIMKQRKAMPKDVVFLEIDAKYMPSGDYNVVLEVRDNSGEVVASKSVGFHRDNPRLKKTTTIADLSKGKGDFIEKLSPKELDYYLTALQPTLDSRALSALQAYFKSHNTDGKKQFLYSHFVKQDPIHPEDSFYAFATLARKVDKMFYSAFGAGFETDRGQIFMRYGLPNDQIKVEDEQFALPYEIWVYEDLPAKKVGSGPIKFLFYNRDQSGENFILLHSNARGERLNPRWKRELFRNDSMPGFDFGDDRMRDDEIEDAFNAHPNSKAIQYFQDL